LEGKTLRVWGEQGVGDEIWAAGMVGELMTGAASKGKVLIECRPKLVTLFQRSFAGAEVVAQTDPPDAKCNHDVDYQIACGSLARQLRPDAQSFPQRQATRGAYLLADTAREDYWRKRVAALGPGLKVGISWRSTNVKGERALMCTRLAQWAGLLALPNVHFVNLQYDEYRAEFAETEAATQTTLRGEIASYPEVDMFDDLDETAALMRSLDLVISAPTTVSILAAALGLPVWQLHYGAYWQGHGTPHNLWYPAMRVFHRKWDEDWEAVMQRVADALGAMANQETGVTIN
jgi:hypothetical protein